MKNNQKENLLENLLDLWPYLRPWQRRSLCLRAEVAYAFVLAIDWLYFHELYIFPPLAFIADYLWMSGIVPSHPIRIFTILSTAFMSATLTLFLLRPPKRKFVHWINPSAPSPLGKGRG